MSHRPTSLLALTLLLVLAPVGLHAQAHDHQHAPYAGQQDRAIKALSADEVEGLLAGDGMGFALAAELNGIPGPKHVLELARELELTAEQTGAVQVVFDAMQTEAQELGQALVDAERHLDMMFAQRHATRASVLERTTAAAELRGRLRAAHLAAHLETEELLTSEQVTRYAELRGYAPAG